MARKYVRADKTVGICQRCSKKQLRKHMVEDGYYPGLMVCPDCADQRHPQERLPKLDDPVTVYKPAPDDVGAPPELSVELVPGSVAALAMGGTIVFEAASLSLVSGASPVGLLTYAEDVFTGNPVGVPGGTLISGTLAGFGDIAIIWTGETGGQIDLYFRVPNADARVGPEDAYWETLEIPGILSIVNSVDRFGATDVGPDYTSYRWALGGFGIPPLVAGVEYTATFLPLVEESTGSDVAHLTWTEAAPINARIDSYDLYRRELGETTWTLVVSLPITYDRFMDIESETLEYDDDSLTAGVTYEYYVNATTANDGPDTLGSNIVSVTATPAADTFRLLQEDGDLIFTEASDVLRWELVL